MPPRKSGRIIVISAPSGAGKTSVIHRLRARNDNMIHSVSATTRPMRKGEIDGRDYHFIDETTFKDWIGNGKLAEWNRVHNHGYGTPKEPLDKWLADGKDILLDLDVVGGLRLTEMYRDRAISIFLLPPSQEELVKRLNSRGTDSKEVRELRLKNAMKEMTYKDKFDHQVVNDALDKACFDIEGILYAPPRRNRKA